MEIYYQCSNCGKKFVTRPIPGVPDGMYGRGCRAVGDAFYCEDCVKTWKDRNGEEFDSQIKDPPHLFAEWWNRTVEDQAGDKSRIKRYKRTATGSFYEVPAVPGMGVSE